MVPPVGSVSGSQSAAIPDKPNLLHLHRATLDPNWPKQLPAPSIFGYKQLGSRLFIRDMSEMLAAEIPLALAGGGAPQQQLASPIPPYPSIVLMGNSGVGKVRLPMGCKSNDNNSSDRDAPGTCTALRRKLNHAHRDFKT